MFLVFRFQRGIDFPMHDVCIQVDKMKSSRSGTIRAGFCCSIGYLCNTMYHVLIDDIYTVLCRRSLSDRLIKCKVPCYSVPIRKCSFYSCVLIFVCPLFFLLCSCHGRSSDHNSSDQIQIPIDNNPWQRHQMPGIQSSSRQSARAHHGRCRPCGGRRTTRARHRQLDCLHLPLSLSPSSVLLVSLARRQQRMPRNNSSARF